MQGLILTLPFGPRNEKVRSYTTPVTVPAGVTRIINFKAEFRGIARSIFVINRDGVNVATLTINNDRINQFTLAQASSFSANDQWIEQLEVAAGAAGVTNIFIEIVPESELGLG